MSAALLVAEAEAASLQLWREGDRVRWRGDPSPELLAELRAHKAELLEILKGDRCRRCGGRLDHVNDWSTRAFGDGSGAHGCCYYLLAGERAVLSPDALADEAELTARGEPPP